MDFFGVIKQSGGDAIILPICFALFEGPKEVATMEMERD